MADFTITGSNRQLVPGTFTEEDSVTFLGTRGNDTLIGGGGELFTTFLGTPGNDLYGGGSELFSLTTVDYSKAPSAVVVNMDLTGTRTFTDEAGEARTVAIRGMALRDGYGGTDSFMEFKLFDMIGQVSGITGVIGSRFGDTMVGLTLDGLHGGGGNDRLVGNSLYGDDGNDLLIGRGPSDWSITLFGGDGNDCVFGTAANDVYLVAGAGNDRVFAGAGDDRYLVGEAGNDFVDAGTGDDFIDGGIGADVLVSGAGNDIINPDVELFQLDPDQPTDGTRDVIRITRDDVGAYRDEVLHNAFEEGIDQIRFGDAVRGGRDFRVYQEPVATVAGSVNTVLQIDRDGDGFGGDVPDESDYFLVVQGAALSLHHGYILT